MSFYVDSGGEPVEVRLPRRVYASLDSTEPEFRTKFEPFAAYFEAVDADWFDSLGQLSTDIADGFLDLYVSVLEFEVLPADKGVFASLKPSPTDDPFWIEFLFSPDGPQYVAQFTNLFTPPVDRAGTAKRLTKQISQRLENFLSTDGHPDAVEQDLLEALKTPSDDGAAVYDVGQGNCNAILDGSRMPTLYYDFGGGVLRNAGTYPTGLVDFCFTHGPAIVLSHWDWDHWSSALRHRSAIPNKNATQAKWIVPRQRLGTVHRGFLAKLPTVHFWPSFGLAKLSAGSTTIHKCTGSGRNHSGLALEFKPSWTNNRGVLMTGDCDYSYLPRILSASSQFDIVVVPHHGGRMRRNTRAPAPAAISPHERYCISRGFGNSYGHPAAATIRSHHTSGWGPSNERQTSARCGTPPGPAGHVWLHPNPMSVALPCDPQCQGSLCQTWIVQV